MALMECRKSVSLSLSKLRAYRQYVFISFARIFVEIASRGHQGREPNVGSYFDKDFLLRKTAFFANVLWNNELFLEQKNVST